LVAIAQTPEHAMEAIMDTVVLERETTSAPAKRRLRFGCKQLALAGLALAIILGGIGYGRYWWTTGRFIESTDDAYVGGNVTALSPHVAGFVSQILVGDNQFVKAGELVITLDDRDYKAALAHAEAVVQNQTAALANLHAKYTLQQSMIDQAEADLAAKQADAGYARADAARYHALALTTYGTVQNDQKAFAADRKATATVRAGEANLDAAKRQLAVIDTEIGETQASLAMAQADLRTAQPRLHANPLADRRLCRQPRCAGRRLCRARSVSGERDPGAWAVGRRQF
jgi:membrane fusion protein (multidrug efflux system)